MLDVPVDGLRQRSFQWWVKQLPIKLGGLGVRLQTFLAPISYMCSLEKCLPSFAGTNLAYLYSEEEANDRKWQPLRESGSRLAGEFQTAWNTIKGEAVQCANFLGEELPEIFTPSAEGFGAGCVSGSREDLMKSRELLLSATMSKALSNYQDQSSMAVQTWKNRVGGDVRACLT